MKELWLNQILSQLEMNEKSNLNVHHLTLILEKQHFLHFIEGDKFIVTPEQDSYFILQDSFFCLTNSQN